MADDCFTFGGASGQYRPILDSPQARTPVPMAAQSGEWLHIPYGGNAYETDGGRLHTTWSVRIWIPDAASYAIIRDRYHQFAPLSSPFWSGTRQARLAALDVQYNDSDQSYRGNATWEWA